MARLVDQLLRQLANSFANTISQAAAMVENFGVDDVSGCQRTLQFPAPLTCDSGRIDSPAIENPGGHRFRFGSIEFWFADGYAPVGSGSAQIELLFLAQVNPLDRLGELLRILFDLRALHLQA
jgi:hypothetical protein